MEGIIRFFEKFAGIFAGMTGRSHGDMRPNKYNSQHREDFLNQLKFIDGSLVNAYSENRGRIAVVDEGTGADIYGDALVTNLTGKYMAMIADDYPTIFFYDPLRDVVGIARGEPRSLYTGFLLDVIRTMVKIGAEKERILVSIGPGVCQAHFELQLDQLWRLGNYNHSGIVKTVREGKRVQAWIDIKAYIAAQLSAVGISEINISKDCTACEEGKYFSARQQEHQKMLAIIGMTG